MSDITLSDPEVSRYHAQFVETETGYRIQDMGSTNGTFVEEERLGSDPVNLAPGQTIMLGSGVVVEYQLAGEQVDSSETIVEPSFESPMTEQLYGEESTESGQASDLPPLPEFDEEYVAPSSSSYSAYEPLSSPPPPSPPLVPPSNGDGKRRRNRIIAMVVILVVCCCCAFLVSGWFYWGDPLLDFLRQQGLVGF
jgi:hypothetical protein